MENRENQNLQPEGTLPPVQESQPEQNNRQNRKEKIQLILSYILVALMGAVITAVLIITFVLPQRNAVRGNSKLNALESLILQCFIGDKDKTAMEDAAAQAMIESLGDRWSYYIPAEEYKAYEERMKNAYVGIGVTVKNLQGGAGMEIISITKGGPAEEAKLKVGDIIVAVDDNRFTSDNFEKVKDMIRGKENTKVSITVLREDQEQTVQVTRKKIHTPVAKSRMLENNVGLVKILNFNENCARETIGEIEKLKAQGAEKIIFDVRFNPGGYANELVKLLDYLLPEGDLFRRVDYTGAEHVDKSDAKFLDMPMAVLVNGDSYSAAEFFAAALSEYEAATVVGEKTCGKGYFQNTFLLPDGSAVGLSIGKYFTPKGISLAGVGITPDSEVKVSQELAVKIYTEQLDPMEDPQVQAALKALD